AGRDQEQSGVDALGVRHDERAAGRLIPRASGDTAQERATAAGDGLPGAGAALVSQHAASGVGPEPASAAPGPAGRIYPFQDTGARTRRAPQLLHRTSRVRLAPVGQAALPVPRSTDRQGCLSYAERLATSAIGRRASRSSLS